MGKVVVRVPATSANMGPGFDCLGVALGLYNTFEVEERDSGLEFEGCEEEFRNDDNLFLKAMKSCFEKTGYKYKGFKITMQCDIPVSRGLGSSAACIVGGIMAANEFSGGKLKREHILELATELEGHPDNVAPAIYGGARVSILEEGRVHVSSIKIAEGIKFCALIPEFRLSTELARAVLPETIARREGVFNVGRASLMVAALVNGDFNLLNVACMDRLHQPYRGKLIDDFEEIIDESKRLNCLAVFLSGAGPTIMAVLKDSDCKFNIEIGSYLKSLRSRWESRELKLDNLGARIISV